MSSSNKFVDKEWEPGNWRLIELPMKLPPNGQTVGKGQGNRNSGSPNLQMSIGQIGNSNPHDDEPSNAGSYMKVPGQGKKPKEGGGTRSASGTSAHWCSPME